MLKVCQCIYGLDPEEKERLREFKELRKRSQEIDKELKKSGTVFKQTIKLLLLGTGESGKSTVLKQMRIIHISKFSEQERRDKINDIKSNIRDSILSILDAMERFKIAFDDESLSVAREYVYDNIDVIFATNKTISGQQPPPSDDHNHNSTTNTNNKSNIVAKVSSSSSICATSITSSSAHLKSSPSSVFNQR